MEMKDCLPGTKATYFAWRQGARVGLTGARKFEVTIIKALKCRVKIQMPNGKFVFVEPESLNPSP